MPEENLMVIVFDVETTGTQKDHDQIIELSAQKGTDSEATRKTWRFKPSIPISPGAQQVHGISMEDLKDCNPFSAHADELRRIFDKADVIVGYNVSFDIDMLQAEFQRIKMLPIDVSKKLIIDPFRLWQRMEPRTLQDAHRRFVGEEFEESHSADADIAATARVLQAMLKKFKLSDKGWEDVADICEPQRRSWIGSSHHVQWKDGFPVIAFGKHAGRSLQELAAGSDSSYLNWITSKDFPEHVKRICKGAIAHRGEKLIEWLGSEFGPAPDDQNEP